MTKANEKRNIWLDLFKLYLSWLVICIHIAGAHYSHFGLYRLAVPTFFMISGFFAYNKAYEVRRKKSVVFLKRSTVYMLLALGLYLLFNFIICLKDNADPTKLFQSLYFSDIILNFFVRNLNPLANAYHLWFIIALFEVGVLHLFLLKFKKENWYFIIIPLAIAIHLFFNGYVTKHNGTVAALSYTRNGMLFGLPMFGLGYCLAKFDLNRNPYIKYAYLALGILFFFLQIKESKYIAMEVYISSILSGAFLLLFFTGLKPIKCGWVYKIFGTSMPFYVYVLHLFVWKRLEVYKTINDRYVKCWVVFLISVVVYEIAFLAMRLIKWGIGKIKTKIKLPSFYNDEQQSVPIDTAIEEELTLDKSAIEDLQIETE